MATYLSPPQSGGGFRGQRRGNFVGNVRPPGAQFLCADSSPRIYGVCSALPIIRMGAFALPKPCGGALFACGILTRSCTKHNDLLIKRGLCYHVFMTTEVRQFIASFLNLKARNASVRSFFTRARKNVIKRKQAVSKNLSKNVDAIAYGE